jgi:malonyl-CoA O-methyltransferase
VTHSISDNSSLNPYALDRRSVRRRFDRAATSFDGADFVHRTTAQGMLQRLQPMTLQPSLILDLGSATGSASQSLASMYKKARVASIDSSMNMLRAGRQKHRWFSRVREVQADAERLPFADASVDVVFANMLLPWIDDAPALFAEVSRVVRKDGICLYS